MNLKGLKVLSISQKPAEESSTGTKAAVPTNRRVLTQSKHCLFCQPRRAGGRAGAYCPAGSLLQSSPPACVLLALRGSAGRPKGGYWKLRGGAEAVAVWCSGVGWVFITLCPKLYALLKSSGLKQCMLLYNVISKVFIFLSLILAPFISLRLSLHYRKLVSKLSQNHKTSFCSFL